jgi:hypothetical protein
MGSPDARAVRHGVLERTWKMEANAGTMSLHADIWSCTPSSLGIINPFEPELKIKFVCVCV